MPIFPLSLIYFWYFEGLLFFVRVFKNTLLFLEEDMAVGLMLKLLFVPLFHDSSIVGRLLSIVFRLTRVVFGLISFFVIGMFIITLAVFWFSLPLLIIFSLLNIVFPVWIVWVFLGCLLFGLTLYISQLINNPLKPLWKVKDPSQIWIATKLKKSKISFENLLKDPEVLGLIKSLEKTPSDFPIPQFNLNAEFEVKVFELAKKSSARFITPAYFFVAEILSSVSYSDQLMKLGLKTEDLVGALEFLEFKRNRWRRIYIWEEDFSVHHLKGVNRGWLGVPTPALDSVTVDLTRKAARESYPDFLGRGGVVGQVINILSQERDRNVLLIGETGSGKLALVRHLAKLINRGDAPEALSTKRIVAMDISRLLSGINSEGEAAERIKEVFGEVEFAHDIIIFMGEIHDLAVGEASSRFNLQALLAPYLESSNCQFIASTDPKDLSEIIEKNANFSRLFHRVELLPATPQETVEIIEDRVIEVLRHKKIYVSFLGIKTLVDLSSRLIHDRVLPDSAINSLEEAVARASNLKVPIDSSLVKELFEQNLHIPLVELKEENKKELLNLESEINKQVIDQGQAAKVVSDTLKRSATSLRDEKRPIGSFLFVGPTGVGKTELAKTVSEIYFKVGARGPAGSLDSPLDSLAPRASSEDSLPAASRVDPSSPSPLAPFLRFDMSEYQTEESVNRLIGGSGFEGQLTEAVEHNPYSLILLDEFEKANPKILTLFLQVLEDGRLTDSSGKTMDFTNSIIIATSNAASITILKCLQQNMEYHQMETVVREELLHIFKPELINRFDAVVIFKPLSQNALEQVVKLKLAALQERLKDKGYLIDFSPELVSELSKKGYDPLLGARPLRRLIQDTLEAKLSQMILEDKLAKGEKIVLDPTILN